jgi:competence protein ComEC
VLGIVSNDPEQTMDSRSGGASWAMRLRDARWWTAGERWVPFAGRVSIRWRGPAGVAPARYGDLVEFKGRYLEPTEEWRQRSNGTLYTGYSNTHVISSGHGNALRGWCFRRRQAARRYLHAGLSSVPGTAAVLDALLLGQRRRMGSAVTQQFARTGMIHVFAISGLHVGIVALLLAFVLRWGRVPRTHWGVVMVPALVFYVLATGGRPSAIRACLMASIYVLAPLLKREPDALSALSLAALLILAVAPGDLLNIGFILSFSVVAGLILLYPVVWALLQRGTLAARELAGGRERARDAELLPGAQARRWRLPRSVAATLRYLASVSVLTICAWLVSTPLTAYFFERFSPVGLVCNVLAIPLTFVIVLLGCLTIALGGVWVPLAVLVNTVNRLFVWMLLSVARTADSIPGGCVTVDTFPAWAVWVWVAILVALAVAARRLLPAEPRACAHIGEEGDLT